MSTFSGYKTKAFNDSQKFFVLDPNTGTPSFVLGSDLVSQLTPNSNYVFSESTRTTAQATDYPLGSLIQTAGATSAGDNLGSGYLVVSAGEGDFPMDNGNELLVIEGDDALRTLLISNDSGDGSDLIAHTGTANTVTETLDEHTTDINRRTIYAGSVAELESEIQLVNGRQATLAGEFSGIYEFDNSGLSAAITQNPEPGFYIPPASDPSGASGAWVRQEADRVNGPNDLSPAFIEQFINGFGGRGMLAAELPGAVTEQAITAAAAVGDTVFSVASTTNYEVGGRVTVYHDTVDRYETYFVTSVSATSIGIEPGLLYPLTTNSLVERTWYDQAHPGKFYMRKLAQEIARGKLSDNSTPSLGRLYFSQFDSNPTNINDIANSINGAVISYINELNVSQADISKPLETSIGRALFVTVDATDEGAYLPYFNTRGVTDATLSIVMMCRDPDLDIAIRVTDEDSFYPTTEIAVPKDTLRVATKYNFPIKLSGLSDSARIEIVATGAVSGSTDIIVDQVEVYSEACSELGIIPRDQRYTVVALGDSWVAGDAGTTAEREPITDQLTKELPLSRVINSGVGGDKVGDLIARFESDVASHNPDYVIVNVGTNDSYNPLSGTFFPNAVDLFEQLYNQLIGKIRTIGAKPIIIGMPALAEEDGSFTNWQLNDRAKTYSRYFWKRYSRVSDYVAGRRQIQEFTPSIKIGGSESGITYSSRSGYYQRIGGLVYVNAEITLSSKGSSTGTVSIAGLPIGSNPAIVSSMNVSAFSVSSASAVDGLHNISETDEIRVQLTSSSAGGTVAATDAYLTNTSKFWVSGFYPALDG